MGIIRFAIENPVKVTVMVLLLVLFGLLSLYRIPIQLTPNVDQPLVTVTTGWSGANPQEIEDNIVRRQEEKLKTVSNLTKMSSESRDNQATISLEFAVGTAKNDATREVSDKLRQVSGYEDRESIDEPVVEAADAALASPIAWLLFEAPGTDITEQQDFVEDNIKPILERVPGVASAQVLGGRNREVNVIVDPAKLAARGVTFARLEAALRSRNVDISAGTSEQGKRDLAIRTTGKYEDLDAVLNTVVMVAHGGPVYVRDVAEVRHGFANKRAFVRSEGEPCIAIPIRRETGTNVLDVMAGVSEAIAKVNDEILTGAYGSTALRQVYDETIYITSAIELVKQNIVIGGILATIVLLIFLRSASATGVVAVAIPIAVIGTFLVVTLLGRNLNVVMLSGMAFAVGMVVDAAVVVLENIYRHVEMGKTRARAALEGAHEVWGAVLAGTLTTMAVFLPVLTIEEEAGQLFRDIAIAISSAVGLSLVISVTVIPALSARVIRTGSHSFKAESGGRIARAVAAGVGWINSSILRRLAVVVGLTALAVAGTVMLVPPSTYLPNGNRNMVFGIVISPPGYSLDEFDKIGQYLESRLEPYWSCTPGSPEHVALSTQWQEMVETRVAPGIEQQIEQARANVARLEQQMAQTDAPQQQQLLRGQLTESRRQLDELPRMLASMRVAPSPIDQYFYVAYQGRAFMGAISQDDDKVKPMENLMNTLAQGIPDCMAFFRQPSIFGFRAGGSTLEVDIRGDDLGTVTTAAGMLFAQCMQRFGRPPQPDPPNFSRGRQETRFVIDEDKAKRLGMTVRDIGFIVRSAVDGATVGEFRLGSRTVDMKVRLAGTQDEAPNVIQQVPIATPTGQIVPLGTIIDRVDTTALQQINRIEEQRSVTLTVDAPRGVALETMQASVQEMVDGLRTAGAIAPTVTITYAGNADKLVQTRNALVGDWRGWRVESLVNLLSGRFFISMLVVYLLMAALFESFAYPLVIMFSVPLAMVGGFIGLAIAHAYTVSRPLLPTQEFDVLTGLGFIILLGVVVNNAILIVHQALNNMRDGGMEPSRAIIESVKTRVRPVFMTSMTSIFGMGPLCLRSGPGSELYRGLGSVMVGGLLVSAVFTLVMVPALLSLAMGAKIRLARLVRRSAGEG